VSTERKIVIIGGAGFIGHHLALALTQQGADVKVIDGLQINNVISLRTTNAHLPYRNLYATMLDERLDLLQEAGVELLIQDARDYHALGRLLDQIRPDVIVHAAAVAHAGQSNKDPYTTFDHSLRTLENALDYARGNVEQFIYLSSSMVYGNFLTDVVEEDHPLEPVGIYGALKVAGEKMVIAYNQVFDLDYTIVRPSALYGQRCISRRVGQIFIEQAIHGESLTVAGEGAERLDFTYIDDLVQGMCRAIDAPQARNEIFNLTYGESRALADLVALMEDEFAGIDVRYTERDRLMPKRGTLSVEKARRLLGYAPENPIETGFPKYIEWYRSLVPQATGH
jgi:nucleoside-diphosphate-sugar epimerase